MKTFVAFVLLASVILAVPAAAQTPRRGPRPPQIPPHLVMERLSRMTKTERATLLRRLPSERRAAIEDRLRTYEQMPEPAKKRLRREYELFRQLPPEKQEEVREFFRQLGEFPEERRRVLRRELVRLRHMPPERRDARIRSERFKENFSQPERDFLSHLSGLLAHAPAAN